MNTYPIPVYTSRNQLQGEGPEAILPYSWFDGAIIAPTSFCIDFFRDSGFRICMRSAEIPDPCRFHAMDEPVYEDSCMEFFADFFPELHLGYVNIEVNAAGAMLCMFGPTRENRRFTAQITDKRPTAKTVLTDNGWKVELFIPLDFIEALYGTCHLPSGHIFRGNVYKCGDKTSCPHWGSWNWLGENPVDFHQPETFGEFVLNQNSRE